MKITTLPLGPLEANCYIVSEEDGSCAVIDPGAMGGRITERLRAMGLTPQCVLLTHGHFDHVGAVAHLREQYPGVPVFVHEGDTQMSDHLSRGLQWTDFYRHGDSVQAGSLVFRVISTPGHTPGSVCLQIGNTLFTGDTLFAGSCGRTDFPGGSWGQMMDSLVRIARMGDRLKVLPGHGEGSDVETERKTNPYVREAEGT